jgi:sugar (pentulose or hexulose) kinase
LTDPELAVAVAVARHAQGADAEPVIAETHEPDPDAHERLQPAQEQFEAAWEALRPLHHALNG